MISIKSIFPYGPGPCNLLNLQPYLIALDFKDSCTSNTTTIRAVFYGDFKEHLRDFIEQSLKKAISPMIARVSMENKVILEKGVCGLTLEAIGRNKEINQKRIVYFNKLGIHEELFDKSLESTDIKEALDWTYLTGRGLWEFALAKDIPNLEEFVKTRWKQMQKSISRGLNIEGGTRRASLFNSRSLQNRDFIQQISKTLTYALSVIEESSTGKNIVSAPTVESGGIIPGVLLTLKEVYSISDKRIEKGLITAGFIGKLLFREILNGDALSDLAVATAMASAAATQIMGGSPKQVVGAASIALKELKCQNPLLLERDFIQLNSLCATKAIDISTWALLSDNNINTEIENFNQYISRESLPVQI